MSTEGSGDAAADVARAVAEEAAAEFEETATGVGAGAVLGRVAVVVMGAVESGGARLRLLGRVSRTGLCSTGELAGMVLAELDEVVEVAAVDEVYDVDDVDDVDEVVICARREAAGLAGALA